MLVDWRALAWPVYRERLIRSKTPILVGPWHSEVGFEALYWMPFVEHLKQIGIARDRLIPISRGGASQWYQCPMGLELFAMRSVQDVRIQARIRQKSHASVKQLTVAAFDRHVWKDAAQTCRLDDYLTLHPAWMYRLLEPFWAERKGIAWLNQYLTWTALPPPPLPDDCTLPPEFIAVRFYTRSTFTGKGVASSIVTSTIQRLASLVPVVVLHSDIHADDHTDILISAIPNVTMLRDLTANRPETNLLTQSAVLARAGAFVGTYGGFAQLALRFGRAVVSFYDQWQGTMPAHRYLSEAVALQTGVPFLVLSPQDAGLIQHVIPPLVKPRLAVDPAELQSA